MTAVEEGSKSKTLSLIQIREKLESKGKEKEEEKDLIVFDDFSQIEEVKGKRVKYEGRVVKLNEFKKHYFARVYMKSFDFLQCYISKNIQDSEQITEGCTLMLIGKIESVPEKHSAPGDIEMLVDSIAIAGKCPPGGVSTIVQPDSLKDHLLNKRHLSLRYPQYSIWIYAEAIVGEAFREFFMSKRMVEVYPPTLTKTKAEGGSEVFEVQYFKQKAYLTQSSQMYLEALVPVVGDCFCYLPSYRAEPSQTYRHLAEYTHIEAEMQFFTLKQLMDFIEELIKYVDHKMRITGTMQKIRDYYASSSSSDNKVFYDLTDEPFLRYSYKQYVDKLREMGITEESTGRFYEYHEDIPSLPEKLFINKIGKPTFIYGIPRHLKAFYMKPMDEDDTLADCCDLLLPGIGEVFGASVRMHDLQMLREAHMKMAYSAEIEEEFGRKMSEEEKEEVATKILESLKFYEDLREFGYHYTAGFGAGLSRMLLFYGCEDIKFATPFARTIARLEP